MKIIFKYIDKPTLILYLLFVFFGWFCIYSASNGEGQTSILDFSYRSGMQLIWIGISLATAFMALMISTKNYLTLAYFIYGAVIILLIFTLIVATDIKGSRSWLQLGAFSVQPAEFAKFATSLALARLFGEYSFTFKSAMYKTLIVGAIIFLPMSIILLQSETGTALVFLAIILMLYREGLQPLVLVSGFLLILLFVVTVLYSNSPLFGVETSSLGKFLAINITLIVAFFFWKNQTKREHQNTARYIFLVFAGIYLLAALVHIFIFKIDFVYIALLLAGSFVIFLIYSYFAHNKKQFLLIAFLLSVFVGYSFSVDYIFDDILQPHQQKRIKVLLGMENDPKGAGWNVNQAKIAIGSGGFLGKGVFQGTQTKLKYVPEQDTDFIFCTIGEELGFWGSALVIGLFAVFLFRLISIAERQTKIESRVYGYCVVGIFLFHLVINVGMVLGIMPVIGIPLPFFSYGGSSLLAFTILLFIFLKMDISRRVNK
ncbi:MAG: rod shape-determining protein RodA [Prevotellaceae bacterium]|jgi:rod shape determining protein RodA|nr:rod shape-determining protein RodA [Prevotellaceae bacterium]